MSAQNSRCAWFAANCRFLAATTCFPIWRERLLVIARLSEHEAELLGRTREYITESEALIARADNLLYGPLIPSWLNATDPVAWQICAASPARNSPTTTPPFVRRDPARRSSRKAIPTWCHHVFCPTKVLSFFLPIWQVFHNPQRS
jgi:hypothetical protein